MNRARIVTWSLMLGAIFPDSDIFRDMISRDELLILTWHRGYHAFAVVLADFRAAARRVNALVRAPVQMGSAIVRRAVGHLRRWNSQPHPARSGYVVRHDDLVAAAMVAAGVGSDFHHRFHTGCDSACAADSCVGLRETRRLARSRVGKLVDVQRRRRSASTRIAQAVDAPFSVRITIACIVILAAIFLLPGIRFWGVRVKRYAWNFVGLSPALAYIASCDFAASFRARSSVQKFAAARTTRRASNWRSADAAVAVALGWIGAHAARRLRSAHRSRRRGPCASGGNRSASVAVIPLEYRYYPDAPANSYIERREATARGANGALVRALSGYALSQGRQRCDCRSFRHAISASRGQIVPQSFTYRVRFDAAGNVAGTRLGERRTKQETVKQDRQRGELLFGRLALGRMNHHLAFFADTDALRTHSRHIS